MAQFYSLEQAARVLGMSPDELKAKVQAREVRGFQDAGNWQFRVADIDELARRRGMGSDPDLSLSDLDLDVPGGLSDSGPEIDLSEFQLGVAAPDIASASAVVPAIDPDVPVDDASLPPELSGSSSTIIGMRPAAGKQPSDSDVKLVPEDAVHGAGDSDVRLAAPEHVRLSDSDVTLVSDSRDDMDMTQAFGDDLDDDDLADDPGATTLAKSPMLGSSAEIEAIGPGDSDSDFELTPSSVIDALQPDTGSDFELTALDQSDEFEAVPPAQRGPSDSDVTGIEPSASGVNLGRPSDSGINLATGGFDLDSADSIELAPLDDEDEQPKAAAKPAPKPKPAPAKPKVDPGATALPIRDSDEKDIFEDTDFEVDALDVGDDRTVQLEATSDFDIDEHDSASEVFAIDEENVDDSAATALGAAPALEEDVFGGDDSGEAGWGDVSSDEPMTAGAAAAVAEPDEALAAAPAPAAGRRGTPDLLREAQGPEWSTPWVVALGFTAVLMLLLAFVGHDLLTNLYEFRGDGPSSGLVKALAGLMGGGG